jgi:predicted DNA-binding protein (MmcQ/YjbR family)
MAARKPAAKTPRKSRKPQKTINKAWHRAHPMPARATDVQRLKWHRAHAQACGCRPIPASLQRLPAAGTVVRRTRSVRPSARAAKRARTATPSVAGLHARLGKICLGLPDTAEVEAWGHPTFRVAGKIFVGFGGTGDGGASMSVKTTPEMQAALVSSDPRFTVAAYVGKHGWVSLALPAGTRIDWNEVEALVRGSYRLVAPPKLAAALPAP